MLQGYRTTFYFVALSPFPHCNCTTQLKRTVDSETSRQRQRKKRVLSDLLVTARGRKEARKSLPGDPKVDSQGILTISRAHTSCCKSLPWADNQLSRRDIQPVAGLLLKSVTLSKQSNFVVDPRNLRTQCYTFVVAAVAWSRNRRWAAGPRGTHLPGVLLGPIVSCRSVNERPNPKG